MIICFLKNNSKMSNENKGQNQKCQKWHGELSMSSSKHSCLAMKNQCHGQCYKERRVSKNCYQTGLLSECQQQGLLKPIKRVKAIQGQG